MADLNIVVAGASGRMGRTLIREIAQGSGIALCGALEMEGHPNLGLDSGTLAGMQPNGMKLTADPLPLEVRHHRQRTQPQQRRLSGLMVHRHRRQQDVPDHVPLPIHRDQGEIGTRLRPERVDQAGFVRTRAEPILGGLVAIHSGWKI